MHGTFVKDRLLTNKESAELYDGVTVKFGNDVARGTGMLSSSHTMLTMTKMPFPDVYIPKAFSVGLAVVTEDTTPDPVPTRVGYGLTDEDLMLYGSGSEDEDEDDDLWGISPKS